MTVSSKNRRKIAVDGRPYLWWVGEDEDSPFVPCALALTVVSEDRRVLVRYHLQQPAELRHVTVLGPLFRNIMECGGRWRRFRCPEFSVGTAVRPGDVAGFIRWCLESGEGVVEVDYRGLPLGT